MVAGASPSAPALTGDLVSRFSTQVGSDVFEPTHGRSRSKSSSTCCGRSHCSGGYRRNPRLFAALTVSFIGITLALDLYLGLSREVKYDRHEYFGSDTNALPILVGSLLAIVVHIDWAVSDGSVSCSLCAASRCPPARPGISERHLSLLPGDRRGDRTDARDVDRCRDAAAIGRWIAAGERSYSIYLWSVLARIAILYALGHTVVGDIVWIAMFVVLSEASFRFVERPLRAKFARRSGLSGPPNFGPVGVRVPGAL